MLNTGNSGIKIQFNMFEVMFEGISVYKLIFNDKGEVTDGILEYINPVTVDAMGLDPVESIGKSIHELFDSGFNELYFKAVNEFFATGKHNRFEVYHQSTDKYFLISGYSPDYNTYITISNDISKGKKIEYALKESEEKIKIAMDLAKLVYWEYDANLDLFTFDDQFYKVYGMIGGEEGRLRMSFKEYAGRFIPPEELSIVKEKIVKGLKTDDPNFRQVEHSIIRADGEKRFIIVRYGLIKDDNGRVIKSYGASQDITEHKQAEDSLKELIEELKCSNYELEQFAYITSHDLQEPLRAIASFAQLIGRRYKGKLDDNADEYIDFMVNGALRMKEMINGLLDYSRIGTQGEKFKQVDIEKSLLNAIYNLKISIEESNAVITYDALPTVNADSRQMVQLFQNLIGNAIKFKKEGKPLKIHISAAKNEEQNEYVFGVSDNGIGIDSEYYDKIFEVFKRLHTMDMYGGTGIGLAIVKRIIERHGGYIWVESELDVGATFYFTVPV